MSRRKASWPSSTLPWSNLSPRRGHSPATLVRCRGGVCLFDQPNLSHPQRTNQHSVHPCAPPTSASAVRWVHFSRGGMDPRTVTRKVGSGCLSRGLSAPTEHPLQTVQRGTQESSSSFDASITAWALRP